MRTEPGFVSSLREEIESVLARDPRLVSFKAGLTLNDLVQLVSMPAETDISVVENVDDSLVTRYDSLTDSSRGMEALAKGHVAFCVLAGGFNAQPLQRFDNGLSLLGMKLMQSRIDNITVPTMLLLNPSDLTAVTQHCNALASNANVDVGVFTHFESLRLTPDNRLSFVNGVPESYSLGDGDLPDAMHDSGITSVLKDHQIKHVIVVGLDNVLAAIDPLVLSHHIASDKGVTWQVVATGSDSTSALVMADGRPQIVEGFRLPDDFSLPDATWHGTSSLIVDVDALEDSTKRRWRYHRTRRQVGGRLVVQYERLLQQLTEFYDTSFVEVPRRSHWLPCTTAEDLRRAEQLLFAR